ncbi:MAG: hypothetical protein HY788_01070 [Deltaproteobacteria bacterium]|nr:hypothetical protein [Deltaproteobacteria bacterium]
MKATRNACFLLLCLFSLALISCGGGGSSAGPDTPPQGSSDPADVVLGVRYQIANVSASQSSTVYGKVIDYNGDKVKDGTVVRFRVFLEDDASGFRFSNSLTSIDIPTVAGVASAVLTHVGQLAAPRIVVVQVSVPGFVQVVRSIDIFFYSDLATSFQLLLTPDKVSLNGDGQDHAQIRARLINAFSVPFVDAELRFSVDPALGSFVAPSLPLLTEATRLTNERGEAFVEYIAPLTDKAINVTITGTSRLVFLIKTLPLGTYQVFLDVFDMISLGVNAQEPGFISVEVDPPRILASDLTSPGLGTHRSEITIKAFDINGNPMVDGTVVHLKATNSLLPNLTLGLIPSFAVLGQITDSAGATVNGGAIVSFFSEGEPGVAVITASIGDIEGSGRVEIEDAAPLQVLDPETGQALTNFTWSIAECVAATKAYKVSDGLADVGKGTYIWEITGGPSFLSVDTSPTDTSTGILVYDGSELHGLDAGQLEAMNTVIAVTDTATGKVIRFSIVVVVTGANQCEPGQGPGDPDNPLELTITPVDDGVTTASSFTVGNAGQINFEASGGTQPYVWTFDIGTVTFGDITFASADAVATLLYNGDPATDTGVMTVTVTDTFGARSSALIAMILTPQTSAFTGALQLSPTDVGVGGEVVAQFTLENQDGDPAPGQTIIFQLPNAAAAAGTQYVAPTTGTTITADTDSNGNAIAVIQAGDTADTTTMLVRAVFGVIDITETFEINKAQGLVEFSGDSEVTVTVAAGAYGNGALVFVIAMTVTAEDGNGNPLASMPLTLDSDPDFEAGVTSFDPTLPFALTTDDDGEAEFILRVAVQGFSVATNETISVASLVLVGTTTDPPDFRGSKALILNVRGN